MSYVKQNFYSGQTLLASHLNHIEDGIDNISTEVNKSIQEAAKQAAETAQQAAASSATAAKASEAAAEKSAQGAAASESAAKAAQTAAETAKANADTAASNAADAKNTLESIPADYSTLSGKVDENTSGISELKEDLSILENILIQIQEKLNQGTVVDHITVNEINDMIVAYFENKTVSEVEG